MPAMPIVDFLEQLFYALRETLPRLLGWIVAGIVIGFILGRHYSPQADKVNVAAAYLLLYGTWSTDGQKHDSIQLSAYPNTYTWTTGDSEVKVKMYSPTQLAAASVSDNKDWDSD